jgi:hypothetical protein
MLAVFSSSKLNGTTNKTPLRPKDEQSPARRATATATAAKGRARRALLFFIRRMAAGGKSKGEGAGVET